VVALAQSPPHRSDLRLKTFAGRALLLIGAWAAVVLFTTSQLVLTYTATGGPAYWSATLRNSAIQWGPWLIVAPIVIAIALRVPAPALNRPWIILGYIGGALAAAVVVVALAFVLRSTFGTPITRPFRAEFLRNVHSIAVIYVLIVAGAYGAASLRQKRERDRHVARLEVQLADAKFSVLQAQLQPHFLFNTLHGVSSLIHEDPDAAEDMLTALSDLLRITLGRGDQREVTLRDDLSFLTRYLEIHKMRLGDRLRLTIDVSNDAEDCLVPAFVIQPAVENAIRYAISPRREGGRLEVRGEIVGDNLRLTIIDDGPGLANDGDDHAKHRGSGIGLANTRARLEQMFGNRYSFSVANGASGGAVVDIRIPARRATLEPTRA